MPHDENTTTKAAHLLKEIRHSGRRLFKSLSSAMIRDEVTALRDKCDQLLKILGSK
jgi:hypothetical protein